MGSSTQVNVRLDTEQARKLERLAKATRRKRCDVMRLLLAQARLTGNTDVRLAEEVKSIRM